MLPFVPFVVSVAMMITILAAATCSQTRAEFRFRRAHSRAVLGSVREENANFAVQRCTDDF